MLITAQEKLLPFTASNRYWQGIPSVECTEKGRIFVTFYSGSYSEYLGNYCLIVKSDDNGHTFSEPIAVSYEGEKKRTYDPCLWIDPMGRLWFFWGVMPDNRVYFSICNDPDAEKLTWSEVRCLGYGVMLNKPTVQKNGDWLFPASVWDHSFDLSSLGCTLDQTPPVGAHVYRSQDGGKTFELLGGARNSKPSFDEHMLLERADGHLTMYLRADYGIGLSDSYDGGITWSPVYDSGIPSPTSRTHIRRLRSGRVILINHYEFTGRSHLTALLSEDDGKTFPYHLLLDERSNVSYPDLVETENGELLVVYDRERGAVYSKNKNYEHSAREILMAKITEEDVLAGQLTSPDSRLKITVSALGFRPSCIEFLKTRIH